MGADFSPLLFVEYFAEIAVKAKGSHDYSGALFHPS